MAHWAKINESNIVEKVLVVGNNLSDEEAIAFLEENIGGSWLKTSYNTKANQHASGGTPFRGNFAGPGYSYDENLDIFIEPQPFDSWTFNSETASWEAPAPMPESGYWYWDESSLSWVEDTEE